MHKEILEGHNSGVLCISIVCQSTCYPFETGVNYVSSVHFHSPPQKKNMVFVLLSALVKRFSVSRMRDFFGMASLILQQCCSGWNSFCIDYWPCVILLGCGCVWCLEFLCCCSCGCGCVCVFLLYSTKIETRIYRQVSTTLTLVEGIGVNIYQH